MSDTNTTTNDATPAAVETPKATGPSPKLGLTPIQALDILIQAVHLAQQKGGVYTLKEAALLYEAVEVFAQQQQAAQQQAQSASTPAASN